MRKNTVVTALGLALFLGASGVASAQTGGNDGRQRERGGDVRGGEARGGQAGERRGGPDAMLLKGITLSANQQARLEALRGDRRDAQAPRDRAARSNDSARPERDARDRDTSARGPRQRGDTVTMRQARERRIASIRELLTPAQRRQFDANVAELRERGPRPDADRRVDRRDERGTQRRGVTR